MSIQWLARILDEHPSKGAERLVMIAIANHADHAGTAYPSIGLIAHEANISPDHAKRAVRNCVAKGWLQRGVNAAPDTRIRPDRRPNLYRILPVDNSPRGGQLRVHGGDNCASTGGRDCPPKPSVNRQVTARADSSTTTAALAMTQHRQRSLLCDECFGEGFLEGDGGLVRCQSCL